MKLGIEKSFLAEIAAVVIENFKNAYPELEQNREKVFKELNAEEDKFRLTLKKGEAEFQKLLPNLMKNPKKIISGKVAYNLYETFGYPLELTEELGAENGFTVDVEGFKEAENIRNSRVLPKPETQRAVLQSSQKLQQSITLQHTFFSRHLSTFSAIRLHRKEATLQASA